LTDWINCPQCNLFRPEDVGSCACGYSRPRFMTAWMSDGPDTFTPTGDAFLTLEAANKYAEVILRREGTEGQIAVFEIRSVHLARLQITRETA
jgi:hypothetical protein